MMFEKTISSKNTQNGVCIKNGRYNYFQISTTYTCIINDGWPDISAVRPLDTCMIFHRRGVGTVGHFMNRTIHYSNQKNIHSKRHLIILLFNARMQIAISTIPARVSKATARQTSPNNRIVARFINAKTHPIQLNDETPIQFIVTSMVHKLNVAVKCSRGCAFLPRNKNYHCRKSFH